MTDLQAAGTPAPDRTFPERRYDLFLREGASRFYWRLRNVGITLSGPTLRWDHDGRPRARHLRDLREVRLQIAHVHRSGDFGLCRLTFNDGLTLTVQSTNARGLPDEARAPAYRDFVRELHVRLAADTSSTIAFQAGDHPGRRVFAIVIVAIAVLFFIALPFGLFLFKPGWELLGVLATGAAFVWPAWKTAQRNAPRAYRPAQVPADLLP